MTTEASKSDVQKRIRTTALRQAQEIEERKKLQTQIADFVVEAFDLPSQPDADPARPQPSDAALFKQCLGLFQPSDLDDLIYERNIDNRCGYALCPRPNQKMSHNGELIWNKQAGKNFKLVNKAEMERWCSPLCQQRTIFVRAQLGTEPAWLRDIRAVDIKLYDEVAGESLADSLNVSLPSSISALSPICRMLQFP
ncbi:Rtr1/RPAP2 family-domain-containing protein [Exophiala viscosa]|uniref:RNA polymerase II subunit B1 CTD phosphatase RPAP2 homolog n=1 Tax=Exophiala viscosa TaxID=2486360 RepID=A0AAN6E7W9_9EURO|nr:Rtr1/RPAP2 family-domain-containing protein [Exophiala viscosa]